MEGGVQAFARHMEGQESIYSRLYEENSKKFGLYAHFPMYVGFGSTSAYTRKYKKTEATMDYSFFALQFLLLQCIQGIPYIALQKGNGGSNPSDIKEYGRPRFKIFGLI